MLNLLIPLVAGAVGGYMLHDKIQAVIASIKAKL
jgi:mannitol-specific phosphotransferase system IIBC component